MDINDVRYTGAPTILHTITDADNLCSMPVIQQAIGISGIAINIIKCTFDAACLGTNYLEKFKNYVFSDNGEYEDRSNMTTQESDFIRSNVQLSNDRKVDDDQEEDFKYAATLALKRAATELKEEIDILDDVEVIDIKEVTFTPNELDKAIEKNKAAFAEHFKYIGIDLLRAIPLVGTIFSIIRIVSRNDEYNLKIAQYESKKYYTDVFNLPEESELQIHNKPIHAVSFENQIPIYTIKDYETSDNTGETFADLMEQPANEPTGSYNNELATSDTNKDDSNDGDSKQEFVDLEDPYNSTTLRVTSAFRRLGSIFSKNDNPFPSSPSRDEIF